VTSGGRPRWLVPVAAAAGIILLAGLLLVVPYNGLVNSQADADRAFADSTSSSSAATT